MMMSLFEQKKSLSMMRLFLNVLSSQRSVGIDYSGLSLASLEGYDFVSWKLLHKVYMTSSISGTALSFLAWKNRNLICRVRLTGSCQRRMLCLVRYTAEDGQSFSVSRNGSLYTNMLQFGRI